LHPKEKSCIEKQACFSIHLIPATLVCLAGIMLRA